MDLFEYRLSQGKDYAPLAEKLRPNSLSDVVGHHKLLAQDGFLSKLVRQKALPSLLLWGPPGTGKTTIGRLLAKSCGYQFAPLSATSAGVAAVRETLTSARRRLAEADQRTVVFIDEIHRFSKSQQDALLPGVEDGTIILVGATTENPGFEVNQALLSRLRVLRMEALTSEDMDELISRGTASLGLTIADVASSELKTHAAGDGRSLLFALEIAGALCREAEESEISKAKVLDAIVSPLARYDKAGEDHFALASALIKSMRGSDPHAACYYLARMLEGGEKPMFIARRLVIFASEDIGNADPQALVVAASAAQATHLVGMPEATYPLTQAAIYLSRAPKSNQALKAYAASKALVLEHGPLPVPAKLRNASNSLDKQRGMGRGYQYPHDFEGTYQVEDLLPEAIAGTNIVES